jgi:hypothetical protein
VLIPCEPLLLFLLLKLSRIYGLDHSEINTSFYRETEKQRDRDMQTDRKRDRETDR